MILFVLPIAFKKIHVEPFPGSPCNILGALKNKNSGFLNIKNAILMYLNVNTRFLILYKFKKKSNIEY